MIIFHLSCLFFVFLFFLIAFLFVSSSLIQVISPSFFCSSFESRFKLFHFFPHAKSNKAELLSLSHFLFISSAKPNEEKQPTFP